MGPKTVEFDASEHVRSRQPTSLDAPAPIANFKGSFVYKDTTTPFVSETPIRKSGISEWAVYFRDGWTDVGIWKSAVSRKTDPLLSMAVLTAIVRGDGRYWPAVLSFRAH